MFVIGVNPVLPAGQVPAGFPARDRLLPAAYLQANGSWLEEGNTVIVAPDGTVLAGPVRQREETLVAGRGLRQAAVGRRHLDPAGHLPAGRGHLAAPGRHPGSDRRHRWIPRQ
ncbi:MAG TPA: hypothetical protein VKV80_15025 [Streptosporangiaceae bacterium]|jgi:nitrilase|nr:hypothetical protein [Streptosporangiaceae bacterium]